jgi:hypothetical protein
MTHNFKGTPVRGEADVLQLCESLEAAMRERGVVLTGRFRSPAGGEEGVDAEATTRAGELIRVQVVGVIEEATMARLGREGQASSSKGTAALADDVCRAIRHKVSSYPRSQRKTVTLALDAIRSPGHASPAVVDAVRSGPCGELLSGEFAEIWLVGPTEHHTYLLAPRPVQARTAL